MLADHFGQGTLQLLIVVSSADGYRSDRARGAAEEIVDQLARSPHVATVRSAWTAPTVGAAELLSEDGRSGLIVAGISGDETEAQDYAKALSERLVRDSPGVTVRAGGSAMVSYEVFLVSRIREFWLAASPPVYHSPPQPHSRSHPWRSRQPLTP
jgi:RND superfamily putative drug exporter